MKSFTEKGMKKIRTHLKTLKLTTNKDKSGWTESSREWVLFTHKDNRQSRLLPPPPGLKSNKMRNLRS